MIFMKTNEENTNRKLINIEESLERFGGMKDLYDELAIMFLNDQSYSNELLLSLLNKNDKDKAASLVHKLKGVAGTLGLEQLFDASKALNDFLHNKIEGNEKELVDAVISTYDITVKKLKELY